MRVTIDYGDRQVVFDRVSYNISKALEEILYEMEFGRQIISKEIILDRLRDDDK